jgi:hypothetical protein
MKKLVSLSVALFLSTSIFSQKEITPLSIGTVMPEQNHKLLSIDGASVETKSLMGEKGLVVIFSCNTCPFVVGGEKFAGWEKDYNMLFDFAAKLGFNLVLINSNEDKREKGDSIEDMKVRATRLNYKMGYFLDKNHVLADAFGGKTTPHVFVFNKEFKLVYTGSIDNQMEQNKKRHTDYLKNALTASNKGKKVKMSTTPPIGCSIKRTSKK